MICTHLILNNSKYFRDNPGDIENSKMDKTEAVINLLQKQNLFVIVLKGTKPNEVKSRYVQCSSYLLTHYN